MTFERIVQFEPAFDKRNSDPHKNYGIHGVNLRMLLKGPEGVVQFLLFTNWHLKHVEEELDIRPPGDPYPHLLCHPQPADLGYHSPKPRYEDQTAYDCEFLDGRKCYYDGSSLNAQRVYDRLVAEGDAGVWAELEGYYKAIFEAEVHPLA